MKADELAGLAERVEQATGADRELDRAIARSQGWHRVEPRFTRNKHGAWIAPEDFSGVEPDGRPRLDSLHGTEMHREVPAYTASFNAATTLVPKGHSWAAGTCGEDDCPWACVTQDAEPCRDFSANAATPALALVAAALRALNKTGEA